MESSRADILDSLANKKYNLLLETNTFALLDMLKKEFKLEKQGKPNFAFLDEDDQFWLEKAAKDMNYSVQSMREFVATWINKDLSLSYFIQDFFYTEKSTYGHYPDIHRLDDIVHNLRNIQELPLIQNSKVTLKSMKDLLQNYFAEIDEKKRERDRLRIQAQIFYLREFSRYKSSNRYDFITYNIPFLVEADDETSLHEVFEETLDNLNVEDEQVQDMARLILDRNIDVYELSEEDRSAITKSIRFIFDNISSLLREGDIILNLLKDYYLYKDHGILRISQIQYFQDVVFYPAQAEDMFKQKDIRKYKDLPKFKKIELRGIRANNSHFILMGKNLQNKFILPQGHEIYGEDIYEEENQEEDESED